VLLLDWMLTGCTGHFGRRGLCQHMPWVHGLREGLKL
jgi:hypothetical protein